MNLFSCCPGIICCNGAGIVCLLTMSGVYGSISYIICFAKSSHRQKQEYKIEKVKFNILWLMVLRQHLFDSYILLNPIQHEQGGGEDLKIDLLMALEVRNVRFSNSKIWKVVSFQQISFVCSFVAKNNQNMYLGKCNLHKMNKLSYEYHTRRYKLS